MRVLQLIVQCCPEDHCTAPQTLRWILMLHLCSIARVGVVWRTLVLLQGFYIGSWCCMQVPQLISTLFGGPLQLLTEILRQILMLHACSKAHLDPLFRGPLHCFTNLHQILMLPTWATATTVHVNIVRTLVLLPQIFVCQKLMLHSCSTAHVDAGPFPCSTGFASKVGCADVGLILTLLGGPLHCFRAPKMCIGTSGCSWGHSSEGPWSPMACFGKTGRLLEACLTFATLDSCMNI